MLRTGTEPSRSDPNLHIETQTTDVRDPVRTDRYPVPGLVVLCHPDARRVGEEVALPELVSGTQIALSRLEPKFAAPGVDTRLRPLAESHLSRQPLLLAPGDEPGSVTLERAGSRTRVSIEGRALESPYRFSVAEVERGAVFVLSQRIALLLHLVDPVPTSVPSFGLIGESAKVLRLRQEIRTAADLDSTVLLRGETGTGKELVARALHDAGKRGDRPFVTVNMAALPPTLAASELFGAARGAYTGADRKKVGFFESADGGTLFLDEIGEVAPDVQALLLRALENQEIQPVGSVETRRIDVRVIAATDSNLETAIAQGRFRAPLLHRLEGYEIRLPPLRGRRDDIARLLYHFLREELEPLGKTEKLAAAGGRPWPPAELVARLAVYDWPGNVRQLRNVARRMAMAAGTGKDDDLELLVNGLLRDFKASEHRDGATAPRATPSMNDGDGGAAPRGGYRRPSEVDEVELLEALQTHSWHLKPAARALGVSRATLYRLIEGSTKIRKAVELEPAVIEEALARSAGDPGRAAAELEVSPQGLKRRIRALGLSEVRIPRSGSGNPPLPPFVKGGSKTPR